MILNQVENGVIQMAVSIFSIKNSINNWKDNIVIIIKIKDQSMKVSEKDIQLQSKILKAISPLF
jgi:hypothetical protein